MIATVKELDKTDKEIIRLAGEGKTAKEIAYDMNRSQSSVSGRIAAMKQYYGCKSIAELLLKISKLEA